MRARREHDSDDEELYCLQNEFAHPFEMWYAVSIRVDPGEPAARVAVEGHCLEKTAIQIPLLEAGRALLARSASAAGSAAPNASSANANATANPRSSPGARSTPSVGAVADERTQFEVHVLDPTGFLRPSMGSTQDGASQSLMRSRAQSLSFAAPPSSRDDSLTRATDDSRKTSKQHKSSVSWGTLTVADGRDELLRLQYMPTRMGKFRARCASLTIRITGAQDCFHESIIHNS